MKEYHVTDYEFNKIDSKDRDGKYIFDNSSIYYFENGLNHRLDGPAIENADGYKAWYINGIRHRLDGPAIERDYEHNTCVYYINNIAYFNQKEYEIALYLYKNNLEIYS